MKCVDCLKVHIVYENEKETDRDDEEFDRHTIEYQDAYGNYFDQLSSENCDVGERLMNTWIINNHGKLCCDKRHECKDFT